MRKQILICFLFIVLLFLAGCGRNTPAPAASFISEFSLTTPTSGLNGLAPEPDGTLWFTEFDGTRISRRTPARQVTEFPLPKPYNAPLAITAGPDGNLWFTQISAEIGRITPTGQITEFPLPTPKSALLEITAGPHDDLWFTESSGRIGLISLAIALKSLGGQPGSAMVSS